MGITRFIILRCVQDDEHVRADALLRAIEVRGDAPR
jgi:hypothetical protein